MQSVNGAQFLNISTLYLSSNGFAVSFITAPVIVIVHLQAYIHHYNHINFTFTLKF